MTSHQQLWQLFELDLDKLSLPSIAILTGASRKENKKNVSSLRFTEGLYRQISGRQSRFQNAAAVRKTLR